MVDFNTDMVIKYLAIGAGAIALPVVAGGVGALSSIPGWTYAIYNGITVGGLVLASTGAGLVDQMFFKK